MVMRRYPLKHTIMRYCVRSSCCGDQEGKISEIEFGIAFRQMTIVKISVKLCIGHKQGQGFFNEQNLEQNSRS